MWQRRDGTDARLVDGKIVVRAKPVSVDPVSEEIPKASEPLDA